MLVVETVPAGSSQHCADWTALLESDRRLPFDHSPVAALARSGKSDLWCRGLDLAGTIQRGALLRVSRSHKLPFMQLGRLTNACAFLDGLSEAEVVLLLRAVRAATRNLVQLSVQLYSTALTRRLAVEQLLRGLGFTHETPARGYHSTLLLPLHADEEGQLAAMTYSARRGIRQVAKHGYHIRSIASDEFVFRVSQLHQAAHRRTGGHARRIDFAALVQASAQDPTTSVLLGVFHPHRNADTALVGFLHGVLADGAVVYSTAGTERAADIGSAPISYGLVWALMRWGQEIGVRYFDFGGITPIDEPNHPLASISEFKRKFGGEELVVASDMLLSLAPLQSRLLLASGSVIARVRAKGP